MFSKINICSASTLLLFMCLLSSCKHSYQCQCFYGPESEYYWATERKATKQCNEKLSQYKASVKSPGDSSRCFVHGAEK